MQRKSQNSEAGTTVTTYYNGTRFSYIDLSLNNLENEDPLFSTYCKPHHYSLAIRKQKPEKLETLQQRTEGKEPACFLNFVC